MLFRSNVLVSNIRRTQKGITYNRKLARLELNKILETSTFQKVICKNFNYEYLLIEGKHLENYLEIRMNDNLFLQCERKKEYEEGTLYKVINYLSLVKNPEFQTIINDWSQEHFMQIKKQKDKIKQDEKEFDERLYY